MASNLKPAIKPPLGVTPNFVNPPSDGYVTVVVLAIFLAITTPIVLLRMYIRYFVNRRLWWDDYTMVIAWVGLFGFAGILFESLKFGNGIDMWNVPAAQGARFIKLFGKLEIIARISMTFTKFSILLLFLRIFKPPPVQKDSIFYSIWFLIWFNWLYCIALVATVLLQCVGKTEIPGQTCINTFVLLLSASTINVITDIAMLIVPLVAVWDLHMPKKRKLGLLAVFTVGVLATASSVARLGWQVQRARDPNRTVVLIIVALLAITEQTIGIIVGCMPVFPSFIRHLHQKRCESRLSKTSSEGRRTGYGGSTIVYSRNPKPRRSTMNDTYLLSGDYKGLDDLEKGNDSAVGNRVVTHTMELRHSDSSESKPTIEGLHGRPHTDVLVSRSIQVESHPRSMETDRARPEPVHVRQ